MVYSIFQMNPPIPINTTGIEQLKLKSFDSTNQKQQTTDDIIAGGTLIIISTLGMALHAVEMLTMFKSLKKVIGFRFFLVLSCFDLFLLLIFGIFPGWIILSKQPGFLTEWSHSLHAWADACWFSMCYMNVVIALTRFTCVVFPLQFRRLSRQSTCWLICGGAVGVAALQSWIMNSASWFVVLWYQADVYGMTCDWVAYAESGTRTVYLSTNLGFVAAYLLIYISTAATIFCKRNLRFQFMAAVFGKSSTSGNERIVSQRVREVVIVSGIEQKEEQLEDSTPQISPNSSPNLNKGPIPIEKTTTIFRTISIIRKNKNNGEGVGMAISTTKSFGKLNFSSQSLEIKLVLPCCINSLIFVVAQLIVIRGGIGSDKWAGFSVMLIFCIQSIAPPILRFAFSKLLREQALLALGLKSFLLKKGRFRLWTVVASFISKGGGGQMAAQNIPPKRNNLH
uniref:7TM_GPCR_Srx domain-containing protein n=1 Tax=Meloidogyne hapla TaxID=6305 RepID=A0A1I8BJ99_MELHA